MKKEKLLRPKRALRAALLALLIGAGATNLKAQIGYISFADAGVESICLDNWDLNGDGELSYDEAQRVTSLGTVFRNKTSITSFDELQYFTGLSSINSEAFYGCSNLTSITLPSSVDRIYVRAFSNCSSLTSIILPSSLLIIYEDAFSGCSNLTSITLPSSISSISSGAFRGCSRLAELFVLSNDPPTIEDDAFYGVGSTILVYVPCGAWDNYMYYYDNYAPWGGFYNFIEMCDGTVRVFAFPEEGGSVTGGGDYNAGTLCTVTATPNEGFVFDYWTESSRVVSYDANYTFRVAGDIELVAQFSSIIDFADANVKALCVANWDTNNDGELSYGEAQRVTSLGTVFRNKTSITSFDELQYFTGLSTINSEAFYGCSNLTSITLPSSITQIYEYAFRNCSGLVELVVLANNPPTVEDDAFFGVYNILVYVPCGAWDDYYNDLWGGFYNFIEMCDGTVSVSASPAEGGSVTGGGNFEGGTLCTVTATPNEGFAFINWTEGSRVVSNDASYTFRVTSDIELEAHFGDPTPIDFADDNVKNLCVANWDTNGDGKLSYAEAAAVTDLGTVFRNKTSITSFDELQYFTGLSTINSEAFYGCSNLTSITLPSSVDRIYVRAFSNCFSLTSIILPSSLLIIYEDAFSGCSNLTSITLPSSISSISSGAFRGCSSLAELFVLSNDPPTIDIADPWDEGVEGVNKYIPVYVPCDAKNNYESAAWGGFNYFYELCDKTVSVVADPAEGGNVTGGGTYVGGIFCTVTATANEGFIFVNWTKEGQVVSNDASYTFRLMNDTELVAQFLPVIVFADDNVKALCVANWDTNNDGELSYAEAAAVTDLGTVFKEKYFITSFDELQHFTSLTTIGDKAFYDCRRLTTITLPNSITTIGQEAFAYCGDLTSIVIPNLVTSIGQKAFQYCSDLTSIVIPNLVTSIGNNTFYYCTSLTSVEIPNSVNSIGNTAFNGCASLESITVLATTPPSLGYNVFNGVDQTNTVLYVPCDHLATYQATTGWNEFNIVENCTEEIFLSITGYGNNPTTTEGWHLIASPLMYNVFPEDVENMTSNNYDLYAFDGLYEGAEWRNYKNNAVNEFNILSSGVGYLYANSETVTLIFKGEPLSVNSYVKELDAYDTKFGDWNLIGNSFTTEATVSVTDYYRIEPGTRNLMLSSGNVNPMEGIFVEYNSTLDEVEFTKLTRGERAIESPMVNIDLRNAEGRLLDRARLRLGEGNNLGKLDMLSDPNRLYFRIDGKDYAVARVNGQGEMPLNFDAAQNGTYSLNVNVEGMEIAYLHLIDNMTGEDIDLLAQNGGDARHCVSTYTFTGKPSDYASRFRLVFETGSSAEGDSFAFIDAAGNIVITADAGTASLQVIDVTGRVVVSVGGHTRCVPTTGIPAGVYVLRLINGNDVMTQKIVVE